MNTSLVVLEVLVLSGLFLVQLYVFRKTKERIGEMGSLIEDSDNLVLSKLSIPVEDLNELTPAQILRKSSSVFGVWLRRSMRLLHPQLMKLSDYTSDEEEWG